MRDVAEEGAWKACVTEKGPPIRPMAARAVPFRLALMVVLYAYFVLLYLDCVLSIIDNEGSFRRPAR